MSKPTFDSKVIKKKFQAPAITSETIKWDFEMIAQFKINDTLDKAFITITVYDTALPRDYIMKVDITLRYSNEIELYVTRYETYITGIEKFEHKVILDSDEDISNFEILRREPYEQIKNHEDLYKLLTKIISELSRYYESNIKEWISKYLWEKHKVFREAYVVFGNDNIMDLAQASIYLPDHNLMLNVLISLTKGLDIILDKETIEKYNREVKRYRIYVESSLLYRGSFRRETLGIMEARDMVREIIDRAVEWINGFIRYTLKDEMIPGYSA
jgi:hypothetical protein